MHTHFLLLMLNTLNVTFISLFTSVFLLHYIDWKISSPSQQEVQKQSLLAVTVEAAKELPFWPAEMWWLLEVLEKCESHQWQRWPHLNCSFCCAIAEQSVFSFVCFLWKIRNKQFLFLTPESRLLPAEWVHGGKLDCQCCVPSSGQWGHLWPFLLKSTNVIYSCPFGEDETWNISGIPNSRGQWKYTWKPVLL